MKRVGALATAGLFLSYVGFCSNRVPDEDNQSYQTEVMRFTAAMVLSVARVTLEQKKFIASTLEKVPSLVNLSTEERIASLLRIVSKNPLWEAIDQLGQVALCVGVVYGDDSIDALQKGEFRQLLDEVIAKESGQQSRHSSQGSEVGNDL